MIEARLAAYEAAEEARHERLEAENAALWRDVDIRAMENAAEARLTFRYEQATVLGWWVCGSGL